MGTCFEVVLRNQAQEYVARISPGDWGYDLKEHAVEPFSQQRLPAVLLAAEQYFGGDLTVIWVNDRDGDGWEYDPVSVPWDGPVWLAEKPDLPYVIPAEAPQTKWNTDAIRVAVGAP